MKGVANFEQQRGTFAKVFNLDAAWRSPGTQLASYDDFVTFVKRFPKSRYYSDSLKRMIFLRNQFAQRELHIANFYMERKRYVAALGRARYVIKHYSQAPQAKEALILSEKINQILSFKRSAGDDRKVLKDTYA
jgi:outer membrane protein assembly factor BamD